jgi:hypothetical protein
VFPYFLFLKAIRLPLCSGELYATGHAAPMGYNPNLIPKTGLLTKIAKRGYLETLKAEIKNQRPEVGGRRTGEKSNG